MSLDKIGCPVCLQGGLLVQFLVSQDILGKKLALEVHLVNGGNLAIDHWDPDWNTRGSRMTIRHDVHLVLVIQDNQGKELVLWIHLVDQGSPVNCHKDPDWNVQDSVMTIGQDMHLVSQKSR